MLIQLSLDYNLYSSVLAPATARANLPSLGGPFKAGSLQVEGGYAVLVGVVESGLNIRLTYQDICSEPCEATWLPDALV